MGTARTNPLPLDGGFSAALELLGWLGGWALSWVRDRNKEAVTDPEELARRDARAEHGVRSLYPLEEGFGLDQLPNGIFGFTFSPGSADAVVFRRNRAEAFEIHKLGDGSTVLLGYVPPEVAATIQNVRKEQHVFVFPRVMGEASKLVCIPTSSVGRFKDYRPERAEGLEIMLVPPEYRGRGPTPPSFRLEDALPSAP